MVTRIDIIYGGHAYSVGQRTLEALRSDVERALAQGSGWIEVNDGEGSPQAAHLLITPGVDLAILPLAHETP
jgi:hypothetical protein